MPVRRKAVVAVAVALTAALLWQHDALLRVQPKPGVAPQAERRVLRVWICESWMGSTAWMERQCADFEDAHAGVSVRIRRAQPAELVEAGAVLPDVLLFAPGVVADPEPLLAPIYGETPVRAELAAAGRWRDVQWAIPVAMGGYALLIAEEAYRTPVVSALDPAAMAGATRAARGKQSARYALQCAKGGPLAYPAALLALGGALRDGWPQGSAGLRGQGTLPEDFGLCTPDKAYADFTVGRAGALIATQREVRKYSALEARGKGFPFRVEPGRQAFTDQLLMMGVLRGDLGDDQRAALCAELLWRLVGEQAQQALTEYGLFPVRGDVPGYDAQATPWLHAMAASLASPEVLTPNAFTWTEGREPFLARVDMALTQGGVDLTAEGIQ
jgi:hypothetical protein